jgi:membrane fusion protein, multidrug efflux system
MLSFLNRRPASFVIAVGLTFFLLYEVSVHFFAYSGDSYVASDIVVLSSEIEGPISKLAVGNNQVVKAGDPLFEIEMTPYRLQLDEAEAAVRQAEANLALADDQFGSAKADVESAEAVETDANATLARVQALARDGYASSANLDTAKKDAATASARVLVTQAQLSVANRRITVARTNIAAAKAARAKAEYQLSKTSISAPEGGRIAPFQRRTGDYLATGTKVMALVTARRRRVVANLAERHLAHVEIGQRAFVTLGTDPWRIHAGRVSGIAPGVSRSATDQLVLPYVEPTTDWVRLPRRFPVEIELDDWPDNLAYHLGADARALILF